MAKRIYWQTVLKWGLGIGIPVASAGLFLYFMYLSSIGAITITGGSGDMVCA